ncbi:MAG TPA: RsmB/NOP family class I SAM-dependent RNA methyltransferase [Opitutaceae bacterium]|nr:RsmB/NOP family class I SAM-dependent RNA methyltransferase [Opitutaceae bacterium]
MSLAAGQQRTFLRLLLQLRPHWRNDLALPARIQALLARNRSFGSSDRRLYRELIYTTLRYLPWIEPLMDGEPERAVRAAAWLAADLPPVRRLRAALLPDWPPCPPTVTERAAFLGATAGVLPEWFRAHCPEAFQPEETDALLARAPLWLRLQGEEIGNIAKVAAEFDARGWSWQRSEVVSSAFRLPADADATKTDAYREGRIEVQDLGSQLVLESIGIEPGGRWLDACAGAGGKSLQLATLLGVDGHVDAHDVRAEALAELARRAERGRFRNITPLTTPPSGDYDGVLVDAPCSGSGTWRRAPHLKWTTTPGQIEEQGRRQLALLGKFGAHVRPGGRLVYATCSLSRRENQEVAAAFLATQPDFAPEPLGRTFGFSSRRGELTVLPARHETDGFFVASFRRRR